MSRGVTAGHQEIDSNEEGPQVERPRARIPLICGGSSTVGRPHLRVTRIQHPWGSGSGKSGREAAGSHFPRLGARGPPNSGFPRRPAEIVTEKPESATFRRKHVFRHFFYLLCAHTRLSQKRLHMQVFFRSKPYAFLILKRTKIRLHEFLECVEFNLSKRSKRFELEASQ